MYQLQEGLNAIRWTGASQPITALPFFNLIRFVYSGNPISGQGTISFQPSDRFSILRKVETGVDYLVDSRGSFLIATDAGPATVGAFSSFPGYSPPKIDTAPVLPVGRTETGIAAEPIIGGRLVAQTVDGLRHYSTDIIGHMHFLFGIALNSALPGGSVSVRRPGYVYFKDWGLRANALLLAGSQGKLITSISPPSFLHVVGRSLTSESMIYQPEVPALILQPQSTV